MTGIITNPINIHTVYCPWEDIDPHDRVLHWEFERLRDEDPKRLMEIIESLSEEEAEDLMYNHAVWARDKQLVDFRDNHTITQYMAGRGFGKLLRKDELVLTTKGWKNIGDIIIGDFVYGHDGEPTMVIDYFEPEPTKVYEITFDTGEKVQVDQDHLWTTWTHRERKCFSRNGGGYFDQDWYKWSHKNIDRWGHQRGEPIGPKVRTTAEIKETLRHGLRGDLNHSIPTTFPLNITNKEVPVEPYILGLWLGDGSKNSGQFTSIDYEILETIQNMGYETSSGTNGKSHYIRGLVGKLRDLVVLNSKHIPEDYMVNSQEVRLELLRGLMDTDGFIEPKNGVCEFCQKDKDIAYGVKMLAASFGEKVSVYEGEAKLNGESYGTKYRVCWRVNNVNPFRLKRKSLVADEWLKKDFSQKTRTRQRMMVDIQEVPIPQCGMRCLSVSNDSNLFLVTDSFIPTHNSYTLGVTMKRAVEYYEQTSILVLAQTAKDLSRTIVPATIDRYAPNHPNKPEYIGNKNILRWPNGAVASMLSAESGEDSPRGANTDILLGDENAFYDNHEGIIDQALMTCRTGLSKAFFFTTPKATPLMNEWVKRGKDPDDDYVRLVTGSTFDNKNNLSKTFMDTTVSKYKGTRFERVELYGELILENDSALFTFDIINRNGMYPADLPEMVEYSIGVDIGLTTKRTASKNHKSDATGIVICGMDEDGICYVLRDFTGVYSVEQWTNKLVMLYDRYSSLAKTHVSIEKNAGGEELISSALEKARQGFAGRCTFTFSSNNKMLRMMPFSLLAEQNKIKFVKDDEDNLGMLFDELTYYDGQGKSPNRFDAMSQSLMLLAPHEVSRTVVMELMI